MASTYKTAGSPSKLLNHQFMIGKNRHIIHQFHFILQRTQRFGEIGWMEGSGGTSESKLPGQWVRNIPNASTAVGEIISGGILGESNPCLKVIIKCDLTWKVWIWAFQFLFFFSVCRIYRALTFSSKKNSPLKWANKIERGRSTHGTKALEISLWMLSLWEGGWCERDVMPTLWTAWDWGGGVVEFFFFFWEVQSIEP